MKTKKIVLSALFAALTLCATFVVKIPSPTQGYVHLGDSFVLTSGWLLGPLYGSLAAGLGSMLSDLLGGYAAYMLPTFLIKALMALVAYFVYHAMSRKLALTGRILGGVLAELLMVGGYYLVEATVFGFGFVGALAGVPGNVVQGVFGVISAVLITELLTKTNLAGRFFQEK